MNTKNNSFEAITAGPRAISTFAASLASAATITAGIALLFAPLPVSAQTDSFGTSTVSIQSKNVDSFTYDRSAVWTDYSKVRVQVSDTSKARRDQYDLTDKERLRFTTSYKEALEEALAERTGLVVTDGADSETLNVSIELHELEVNLPRNAKRSTGTKYFSRSPGSFEVTVSLLDGGTGRVIGGFDNRQSLERFTFERQTSVSLRSDFQRFQKRSARDISDAIGVLQQGS